ncbi:N-acetylglucosamine kinase [Streptomyces sp. TLI_171]|uniref:N-acetylglucosamine kinase n=1 Tax=Streptomyces sp. TLI_171 TaxID=1938859 RepID=UPI000C192F6F|nr:BadF/BadG/BcrA/BcrD ATPase family protein [Streptomyces sp. TLI_171]RKE21608.1 N-acetylglucosamine kinase-like BadF-type ATPase [Streptomyces sp. TLI_171]
MSHSAHLPGVLAVDAGNSKTDLALVSADGRVLGTARGGGFQPQVTGFGAAIDALAPLVADLARQAGVELRPGGRPLTSHVSACLANADLPIEEQLLHDAITAHGWAPSVHVANDTFGLLRAGTDGPLGVAVVCGAGINCVGLRPDGRTARWPALGRLTGDWGGGGGLAEAAMWHAARAEDGRGEATLLSPMIGAHFGLDGANAFAEAMHLGRIDGSRLHEVAQLLFTAAEAGDPIALSLIDRQADEVARLAIVALTRLDLLDQRVPVVFGGGVLAARRPLLNDNVFARLAAAAPLAEPRVVVAPPVLGAALLGLDRLAGDPAAHRRLRDAYPTPHPVAA